MSVKYKPSVDITLLQKQLEFQQEQNALQSTAFQTNEASTRQLEEQLYLQFGISKEDIESFYKEKRPFINDIYSIGKDPEDFEELLQSRSNLNSVKYVNERSKVIKQLLQVVDQSNPELLRQFIEEANSANSKHNESESVPFHYQELLSAAKKAVKGDSQLESLLNKDPRVLLYNTEIRNLTIQELVKRDKALDEINEKPRAYRHDETLTTIEKPIARLADFGWGSALTLQTGIAGAFGLARYGEGLSKDIDFRKLSRAERVASNKANWFTRIFNGGKLWTSQANAINKNYLSNLYKTYQNSIAPEIARQNGKLTLKSGVEITSFDDFAKHKVAKKLEWLSTKSASKASWVSKAFKPKALAFARQAARKLPWVGVAMAAASGVYMVARENPDWAKPVVNTVSSVASFVRNWFVPDNFHVFYDSNKGVA